MIFMFFRYSWFTVCCWFSAVQQGDPGTLAYMHSFFSRCHARKGFSCHQEFFINTSSFKMFKVSSLNKKKMCHWQKHFPRGNHAKEHAMRRKECHKETFPSFLETISSLRRQFLATVGLYSHISFQKCYGSVQIAAYYMCVQMYILKHRCSAYKLLHLNFLHDPPSLRDRS